MNSLTKKEKILLGLVLLMGIIVLISYFLLRGKPTSTPPSQLKSPSPNTSSEPIPEPQISTPSGQPLVDYTKIDQLKAKLPYNGAYFMLSFDDKKNIFLYVYRKEFEQASDNEVNSFLKSEGFNGREDLKNFGLEEFYY